MSKRDLQKEQTHTLLLKTAFDQFGKNGIMATRMSDVAKAAGVSHGTVFAHFETQEVLITSVIEYFGSIIANRTHELADNCAEVRDVLRAYLKCIAEFEVFYTRLVIEARILPKASRNTLIMIQSAISFHLSKAASHEMNMGKIKQMPLPLLFNTWTGLVNYYLSNGDLFSPEASVIERYGEVLVDHFINLLNK